jgi:hypothetical protein
LIRGDFFKTLGKTQIFNTKQPFFRSYKRKTCNMNVCHNLRISGKIEVTNIFLNVFCGVFQAMENAVLLGLHSITGVKNLSFPVISRNHPFVFKLTEIGC